MKFTKMHGAGNDYIYIDARGADKDWSSLSRSMSDRHFGVGGDGIILVLESGIADLKMRMFNSDGSEGGKNVREWHPLFCQIRSGPGNSRPH